MMQLVVMSKQTLSGRCQLTFAPAACCVQLLLPNTLGHHWSVKASYYGFMTNMTRRTMHMTCTAKESNIDGLCLARVREPDCVNLKLLPETASRVREPETAT